MKHKYMIAAAAVALAVTGVAVAQGGPKDHGPGGFGLLEFDGNADGKLTRSEFDAGQKARFADLDADKDGFATREEMKARREAGRQKMEKARFTLMDTDKNGQLSQAELQADRDVTKVDGRRGAGGLGRGGPDHGKMGGPDGKRGGGPDANADSKISFEEFAARGVAGFTQADANKDGTVTVAELQTQSPGLR